METWSPQPGFVMTLNDRRQYTEFDVRRLNLLLIQHGEQAQALTDSCELHLAAVSARYSYQPSDEIGLFEDVLARDIADYTKRVELIRLNHRIAWLWRDLAVRHQDELLMNGFGWSDAEWRARRLVRNATLSEAHCRNQIIALGLSAEVEPF